MEEGRFALLLSSFLSSVVIQSLSRVRLCHPMDCSFMMKGKEESENVGLKLNIQETKIMASSLITSWQIDGETVETVADFFCGGGPKSLWMVIAAMKLKDAYSLEGKL